MQREVCLKHRNNRREIILRVRTQIRVGSGVCSFCHMRCGCAQFAARAAHLRSSFKSRMPECQSGDAGAIPADRTNFQNSTTRRASACAAESPKLRRLGAAPRRRAMFIRAQQRECADFDCKGETAGRARDDAWLRPPCEPSRILQGSQMGRHRPHKPKTSGFDSRPCDQFSKRAARPFRRSLASQAGEHGAKPWRSTFFKIAGRLRTREIS